MRTYVRGRRGDDPPRRRRRVLRVRRAARRPAPARAAGDRRRRCRARGQLRGQGLRRAHGDGRPAGATAVPRGDRRPAAHGRLHRGEQGALRAFEDTTPLVEGLSIDEAFLDVRGMERIAGTPTEIAVRLRRRAHDEIGLPVTVGVARTKFLAKVASAVAKPDGLLVVPPDARARVPAPAADRAGLGHRPGDGGEAPRARHRERRRPRARPGADAACDPRPRGRAPRPRAREQPRPARRASAPPPPLHRVAARPRTLATAVGPGARHRAGRDRRPRHPPAARGRRVARTVVLRMRFDDFTRATRSHTLPYATARTQAVLVAARELLQASLPLIRAARADPDRPHGREPRRRPAAPARPPARRRKQRARSTPPWTRSATATDRPR